jgi:hypothetical protein
MSKHALCPLCRTRPAKRDCPALGQRICAVCCATKRLVEIRCPPTCPYLSSARAHPAAVIQRRLDRDLAFYLPYVKDLSRRQYELLLFFQAVVANVAPGASPALRDDDVAEAAAALAATLETAGKGVIYEHQAGSIPAQRLVQDMRRRFGDALREDASDPRVERDAATALRRLEAAAREAAVRLEGDEPPVFLGLMMRIMQSAGTPERGEGDGPSPEGGGGLIITG